MTHPAPETLAEFIDGKLRGETRDAVVAHIEECDDCLMIVGETSRLFEEAPAPARQRGSRYTVRWVLLAAALVGILFVPVWILRDRNRDQDHDPLRGLVQASRSLERRPVEARLSDFEWLPRKPSRGDDDQANSRLLIVQGVAGQVLEENRNSHNDGEKQHAAGVAALITGYPGQAIQLLRHATEISANRAAYWSDLAAAYVDAYEKNGDVTQLLEALAALQQALRIDAGNLPALFNRGVVLDLIGEREQAISAFELYLRHDGTSRWAADARERLDQLRQRGRDDSWTSDQPRLEQAALAGDDETVRQLVALHRYEARSHGELTYLSAWTKGSQTGLRIAAAIGSALQQQGGDSMLIDAVAAIETADQRGTRGALLAGHRAYQAARDFYRDRKILQAKTNFENAFTELSRGGSPFAALADYYVANCLYDLSQSHDALVRIDALLAATPARYVALRAQLAWERASILARDGAAAEALASQLESVRLFDSLGEQVPANIMRSDAAGSYALLGRRSEAWRIRADILRTTSSPARRAECLELAARTEALAGRWDTAESLLTVILERPEDLAVRVASSCLVWRALAEARLGYRDEPRGTLAEASKATGRIPDPAMRAAAAAEVTFASGVLSAESDPTQSTALLSRYIDDAISRNDPIYVAEAFVQRARAWRRLQQPDDAQHDLLEAARWVAQRQAARTTGDYREAYFATGDAARRELIDLRVAGGDAARALFGEAASSKPWLQLPRGKVLAQFITLPHETIVLSASRDEGPRAVRVPIGEPELAHDIDDLVNAIADDDHEEQKRLIRRFRETLMSPFASGSANCDSIVIIPDGPLYRMPFALITDPVAVAEAPDVITAIGTPRPRPESPPAFLSVGNPAVDRAIFNLPPLPAAEAEANELALLYSSKALCGPDATKAQVASLLTSSDFAHFATHAVASSADPAAACIVLAPSGNDSGALTAREISALPLRRLRVAVLAGCHTAASSQNGGANDSLSLAFLRAGAENVIASLWKTDDKVAQAFSLYLHRELSAGTPPTIAVQRAQHAMRDSANAVLRAPRSWSGFVVTGSGNW